MTVGYLEAGPWPGEAAGTAAQADLADLVRTLRQVLCLKG